VTVEISIIELQAEIDEKSRDLLAFLRAREIIRNRLFEVKDSQSKLTPLPYWSGTDAVLGSLDLAIHSMERTITELKDLRDKLGSDTMVAGEDKYGKN
jgi:hypothetical protein